MSKSSEWTNDDGLVVGFGARVSEDLRGGKVRTEGNVEEHVVEFSYDDLPDGSTDGSYLQIPANAVPIDAYLEVITGFAGGTSYDIDLVDSAGSAIGSGEDKLWDALALADINTAGERSVSSTHGGTNSGNALNVALASAGMLKVAATGTFTAGKARIVIRYVK
ncbi:MAG: hypothetical protein PVJ67_07175 [Candidatus Pacearchaeota archaeon]|jgi:hypothetical protein